MPSIPVAALLLGTALPAVLQAASAPHGTTPVLALFTFAVSAFRGPLR